ncbi:MAG: hypothetical protein U5K71_13995 [Gracilimonas sp.]|nr:hypothetical protein [Gracilimonas sp.]
MQFKAHEYDDVPDEHDGHHDVPDGKYVLYSFSRLKNKDSLI